MGLLYNVFGIPSQKMIKCAVDGHKFLLTDLNLVWDYLEIPQGFTVRFECNECKMIEKFTHLMTAGTIVAEKTAELLKENPSLKGNAEEQLRTKISEAEANADK